MVRLICNETALLSGIWGVSGTVHPSAFAIFVYQYMPLMLH
jgi:hypothetical protein